jgi:hypothetical protein
MFLSNAEDASDYLPGRPNSGRAALFEIHIDMAVRKITRVKAAATAGFSKCATNNAKENGSITII